MTHWTLINLLSTYSCRFYVTIVAQVNTTFTATEISVIFSTCITFSKYAKITHIESKALLCSGFGFKAIGETNRERSGESK